MSDDTISRAAAINELESGKDKTAKGDIGGFYNAIIQNNIDKLRNLPSAQSEIIYCRECKWKQGAECVRFAEVRPFPDDFCSRAKRRTDE